MNGGGRIQARRAGPRRRPNGDILHASGYDAKFERLPHEMLIFMVKMGLLGASWGPLGASWGPLGSLLGASWGLLGAQDEAKMEPSWAKLGPCCDLEPSWRQLGGNLQHKLT